MPHELTTAKPQHELNFPVPWGVVVAKVWGEPSSNPVLLIHGRMDNAGSFDRLIPLLPQGQYYYVALDLPGHGFSSPLPSGSPITFLDFVFAVNRIVKQLFWKQFILIGHSFGGGVGEYYTSLFPDQVTKLISIDIHITDEIGVNNYYNFLRESLEKTIEIEERNNLARKSYPYDVALQKVIDGRKEPISREAAERLFGRSARKTANGFHFVVDVRMRLIPSLALTKQQHFFILGNIACPYLSILTKKTYETVIDSGKKCEDELLTILRQNEKFKLVVVDAGHDVHMDCPEKISPIISDFINNI